MKKGAGFEMKKIIFILISGILEILLQPSFALALPPGFGNDLRITNDPSFSGFPKLALDSSDNIHLVWQENRDGNAEIYYKKLDNNGGNLTLDIRLTTDPSISFYPSVSRDASGNVHVVWLDDRDLNGEIYYTKLSNTGATIIDDLRITTNTADSAFPSLASDSGGNLHLVWVDGRDGNAEIYYKKLDNSGASLSIDIRLTTDPAISTQPAIAVDSNNNLHVVWTDDRDGNSEIYYKKLDNNGNNLTADIRLTNNPADSSFPALARDPFNFIHVAWLDDRDGNPEIYYKKLDNNGAQLVADTRLTTNIEVSWFPAISSDASGYVQIAWTDNRDGNLEIYYTKLNNNGVTILDDTRLTTDPAESDLPAISADTYSNAQILWKDTRDLNEEIYYKRSLRPTISLSGTPSIGGTITLNLEDRLNPNTPYLLVASLGTAPGIPLGDGRVVPLNADGVFYIFLFSCPFIGCVNFSGLLDANGQATASWTIPGFAIPGINIKFAFVTVDGTLPIPQQIVSISTPVSCTLGAPSC